MLAFSDRYNRKGQCVTTPLHPSRIVTVQPNEMSILVELEFCCSEYFKSSSPSVIEL
jgi:hypothetical protein